MLIVLTNIFFCDTITKIKFKDRGHNMTHENKFGMFIHWGIYAQSGLQEQALARYDLKNEDYEKLQHSFSRARP